MKKLFAVATFVALGAGTVGVRAFDNVDLKGSDTLANLTREVIALCDEADPNPAGVDGGGLTYSGTGSGAGEAKLLATSQFATITDCNLNDVTLPVDFQARDCQTVSSMSRFLQLTNTCAFPVAGTVRDASKAEGIAFALDGLSIVARNTHETTCNDDPAVAGVDPSDCNAATGPNAGLTYDKTITVQDANGIPGVNCPPGPQNAGCVANGTYDIPGGTDGWKDVLRIVYTGLPIGENNIFDRDCNGDLRHTLVNNWGLLFQNDCSGSGCVRLQHAFRRADESGTTDVFLALINAPSLNVRTGVSPFCNVQQTGDNDTTDGGTGDNTGDTPWGGANGDGGGSLFDCPVTNGTTSNLQTCSTTVACGPSEVCVESSTGAPCAGTTCICVTPSEYPGCFPGPRPDGHFVAPGLTRRGWESGTGLPGQAPYTTDNQDNDPVRRNCVGTYDLRLPAGTEPLDEAAEQVCRARRVRSTPGATTVDTTGTLGLVLAIDPPGFASEDPAGAYPTTPCAFGQFMLGAAPVGPTGATVPTNDPEYGVPGNNRVHRCPNGDIPLFALAGSGTCFIPRTTTGDARCLNGRNNMPTPIDARIDLAPALGNLANAVRVGFTGNGNGDGRVYNLHVRDAAGAYRTQGHPGATAGTTVNVPIVGAYYRIHSTRTLLSTPACTGDNCCQQATATTQIGCLVQGSPCSIGFAGLEATTVALDGVAAAISLKVDAKEPSASCVRGILSGTNAYPLSRKLFFNSMTGFELLASSPDPTDPNREQELELARCFSGNGSLPGATPADKLNALEGVVSSNGFITRGVGADPLRAPACQDYRQQNAVGTSTTDPNLHGCAQPLVGNTCDDACRGNPTGVANDDLAVPNLEGDGDACP